MEEHRDHIQQLLRRKLLPATTRDPNTAYTFKLLCKVHVLSVQSKLSLYNYYIAIEHLTDATRMSGFKVRLSPFHVCAQLLTSIGLIPRVFKDGLDVVALETAQTGWSRPCD